MPSKAHKGYHKAVLPNGIRVIGEEVPGYNSVTVGIFVFCGGRDEPAAHRGIAHFTEHMLFKGTDRRTSLDISKEIDRVGGIMNAYTNKEYTCYYVKIVREKIDLAMDVLADIFQNSIMPQEELEREKEVVLQEIGMVNDTPDDLVHDLLLESLYGRDGLGHSLLGTEDHVKAFTRDDLFGFIDGYYPDDRIVIAGAGNIDWQLFSEAAHRYFGSRAKKAAAFPARRAVGTGGDICLHKEHLYQIHRTLGFRTVSIHDGDRYALNVLNYLLGGGMSSRLFQELREKTGYAYSVYSFMHNYQDSGYLEIYYGTSPKHDSACIDKVREILRDLRNGHVTDEEIGHAKEQVRGYTLIAQDSSDARFSYNAKSELYFNEFIPLERELDKMFAVTRDDVVRVAQTYLADEQTKSAVITPDETTAAQG